MKHERPLFLSAGATLGLILVLTAALLLPNPSAVKAHRAAMSLRGCIHYPVLPPEWVCGKNVIYVNPDGSRVLYRNVSALKMPRPRPVSAP